MFTLKTVRNGQPVGNVDEEFLKHLNEGIDKEPPFFLQFDRNSFIIPHKK